MLIKSWKLIVNMIEHAGMCKKKPSRDSRLNRKKADFVRRQ